jgi:hypothetical protein
VASRQLGLAALVKLAVVEIAAQAVAKVEHPVDLRTAGRENLKIDVDPGSSEESVLVPRRLANPKYVAGLLHIRDIGRFF